MTVEPICAVCAYYYPGRAGRLTCAAFPKGIPLKVLSGVIDHKTTHHPSDGGLLFKPYEGGDE